MKKRIIIILALALTFSTGLDFGSSFINTFKPASIAAENNNEIENAKKFFENYVQLCYTYDKGVLGQYSDKAVLKRILMFSDGTTKEVDMTVKSYRFKLKFYAPIAKLRGYKNIYYDLKYTKEGNNVRIKGFRRVVYENDKLPISILVGKDSSGKMVILEEILHTKALKLFNL